MFMSLVMMGNLYLLLNHKNHINLLIIIFYTCVLGGLSVLESVNLTYFLMMIVFVGGIMVLMMYTVMMTSNLLIMWNMKWICSFICMIVLVADWNTSIGSLMSMNINFPLYLLVTLIMYLFIVMIASYNMLKSTKNLNVYN
ncbi:NADH dehydrogenase subunit 6 (mitochondrion) [Physella acuta]|uniref:NADH dehydrogenase subunit 6 n=1 Tax=Physella acuta TaxID=109671 RepID=V9IPN2_PHYAT|nr:NADH dehydrogenase subunit 6 [Physella acuta]AFE62762.1 NADH dehydrogenase subunit 6 [Physella acuta]